MATKKKDELTEAVLTEDVTEEKVQDKSPETVDPKDAEIKRLQAELEAIRKKQPRVAGGKRESDYDRIHRIEAETIKSGEDPWSVMVPVNCPHRAPGEDPWYWINVNARSVQIPADDEIREMRLPFACVLVDTLYSEKRGQGYKDSLQVYDPIVNPHKVEDIRSGS